ncbi:MAG: nitrite reductase (NAD(P)H) small subunit, partial [Dehalococcoidia bacterium]
HQGAMLSYGVIEPGQVICPLHSAVFDIKTGECLDRYTDDVLAYPLEVRDGRVCIRLPTEETLEQRQ